MKTHNETKLNFTLFCGQIIFFPKYMKIFWGKKEEEKKFISTCLVWLLKFSSLVDIGWLA